MADYDWGFRDCLTPQCPGLRGVPNERHASDCIQYKIWEVARDAELADFNKVELGHGRGIDKIRTLWECRLCWVLTTDWRVHAEVCPYRDVSVKESPEENQGISVWDPSNPPWESFSDDDLVALLVGYTQDIESYRHEIDEKKRLLNEGMHKMIGRNPAIWDKWRQAHG